jgi:hypothetical protein
VREDLQCAIRQLQRAPFLLRHPPLTISTGATALRATTEPSSFLVWATSSLTLLCCGQRQGPNCSEAPEPLANAGPEAGPQKTPKKEAQKCKTMSQKEFLLALRQPTMQTKERDSLVGVLHIQNTHEIKLATDTAAQRCSVEVRCLIEQGTETTSFRAIRQSLGARSDAQSKSSFSLQLAARGVGAPRAAIDANEV